jgi:hypothetical protein
MRFVPTTMKSPIASFSGVKPSGRRGDGGRSARVERAACCDDFDECSEPCSARRPRASARVAHVQPRRTDVGLMLGCAVRPAHRLFAALYVQLAILERAEVREATKQRAASARAAH